MKPFIPGLLSIATLIAAAPVQAPQAPVEPLDLFKKLMPVLTHPRCMNCHGGVDPVSGTNHPPGPITDPFECEDCHTDTGTLRYKNRAGQPDSSEMWHLPDPSMFWAGKDVKQVCAQLADFVMHTGRASFLDHLDRDSLVILGFLGMSGGAGGPADPPPLTKKEFIDTATVWLDEGMASCVRDGEIEQTEEVNSDFTQRPKPNATIQYQQHGKRESSVTLAGGQYRIKITASGFRRETTTIHATTPQGAPCTTVMIIDEQYASATQGSAAVVTNVRPSGDYTIQVTGPPEKARVTRSYRNTSDCGPPPPDAPLDGYDLDSEGWSFIIAGHSRDLSSKQLVGGCDKTIKGRNPPPHSAFDCFRVLDGAFHMPWLMDHGAGASEPDGTDIPFRVTTVWNFRYQ